ncbi:sigma-70 family RNA polymerase sigma factor [Fulvivirgaceae bacterium BMA10]|uniref:Sigma-70 family RNA polymerase sigma factor n=1 Tax=Splendidivirga corallicola TaxID=3051826 RepID=A0ABT8KJS8_9BACT|nr:sigma-70 family RNA polymerase sigma factor [Fulvivirgaceae bacterium BMA10]
MPDDQIQGLINNIINNDERSFKIFMDHYYQKFKNISQSYVHSNELAEEVVCNVFLKIWQKRSRLGDIMDIEGYIFISVRNESLNFIKKRSRRQNLSLDNELYWQDITKGILDGGDPETLTYINEGLYFVNKAVENLPPRCRLIYGMIKDEGLKYREVANLLGISIKTIEGQMAIAKKRINLILDRYMYPSYSKEISA